MDQTSNNKIVSFIWVISAAVLGNLFKRGKPPDVILLIFVIRRMDAVLRDTKQVVLETKQFLEEAQITGQRQGLAHAAG